MISRATPDFWKRYRALIPEARVAARNAYRKFIQNPAHPSLRLERLRSDSRFWSVRLSQDYRAVAMRFENDQWVWFWIGNHKNFDREFLG